MLGNGSIRQTASQFRDGSLRPEVLVQALLERIEATDGRLGAWVSVWAEQALAAARQAGRELDAGRDRGPLHGIPIGVKDLVDVEGTPTLAGAPKLLPPTPSPRDAHVIARLRAAGAVLLGKTQTHPFAMGTTTPQTHNPWALDRIPGGSSGGSAAALAAGNCLGALGSDTGGSIRLPAAVCGVSGLKPTYGRVSRRGVFPLAWTLDHVGPLAATAEDTGLLLQAMAGHDPQDERSAAAAVPDFLAYVDGGVQGLRVGRLVGWFNEGVDSELEQAMDAAARTLERLGARVSDVALPHVEEVPALMQVLIPAEAATIHRERLATAAERIHPTVRPRLEAGLLIPATTYLQAQRRRAAMTSAVLPLFDQFDVLLAPTTRGPAPLISSGQGLSTDFTAPFNLTGLPVLAVPCGLTSERLPLGMQLVGAPWSEARLVGAGSAYQQATDWHRQRPFV